MTQAQTLDIKTTLNNLFPDGWLRKTARECGALKRQRHVQIPQLFWSLILGFSQGKHRSLSDLRKIFETQAQMSIEESGYQKRFNQGFAAMMRECCLHALDKMPGIATRLNGRLAGFKEIFITDSSVIRLHDALESDYPGNRTNQSKAALKAHMVMCVRGKGKATLKLTSERHPDGKALIIGKWIKGALALFDLGYYDFRQFVRIDEEGGYFVSRLKTNANPTIKYSNIPQCGRSTHLFDQPLQQTLKSIQRDILDVTADLGVSGAESFRIVAIKNQDSGVYHLYVTNIPANRLSAKDIASIYALRWQVELLFRELKSYYHLGELPSRRKEVVEALIYAAFITAIVSWNLLRSIQKALRLNAKQIRLERWAAIFMTVCDKVLTILLAPKSVGRYLQQGLIPMFKKEICCPNTNNLSLIQRSESMLPCWLN